MAIVPRAAILHDTLRALARDTKTHAEDMADCLGLQPGDVVVGRSLSGSPACARVLTPDGRFNLVAYGFGVARGGVPVLLVLPSKGSCWRSIRPELEAPQRDDEGNFKWQPDVAWHITLDKLMPETVLHYLIRLGVAVSKDNFIRLNAPFTNQYETPQFGASERKET